MKAHGNKKYFKDLQKKLEKELEKSREKFISIRDAMHDYQTRYKQFATKGLDKEFEKVFNESARSYEYLKLIKKLTNIRG